MSQVPTENTLEHPLASAVVGIVVDVLGALLAVYAAILLKSVRESFFRP